MRTLLERGLKKLRDFDIEIVRIQPGNHVFNYTVNSEFFKGFDYGLVDKGELRVEVEVEKTTHLLNLHFNIKGSVELECDRSLETFDYPLDVKNTLVVKFGQEEDVLSEDVIVIKYDEQVLNIASYIYEFITVAIPLKKLHPKFKDEDDEYEELIYQSGEEEEEKEISPDDIDPRWKGLLKLKNKGK